VAALLLALGVAAVAQAAAPLRPGAAGSSEAAPANVDAAGQRAFSGARGQLFQVRTLLRGQDSQASVGSGFLVTEAGHLITNYHVVSQFALRPKQYRLTYTDADGRQGALQLLDVDVVHDLALLKIAEAAPLAGRLPLAFRPAAEPLRRGEGIHALGNPLDVGFAVMGGVFNGRVERSYLPTIFFGGSLSPGMSGGPTVDERGRVIGVNVAKRLDGEQVSFLVPAEFAAALLARSRDAAPVAEPMHARLTTQLLAHQDALVAAFLAQPWRPSGHARWRIPVPQETFMRCWGSSNPPDTRGLLFERSDCSMASQVFVSGGLRTGHLHVRHESYDGRRLGAVRFAERYSRSYRNEQFSMPGRQQTAPQCHEHNVQAADGLPLRALMCLRAYKRFAGLFDMSILVATLDGTDAGAQGRLDAFGVSFASAQKLAAHHLAGFGRVAASEAR
jgi:S1-C subfamily serine protease